MSQPGDVRSQPDTGYFLNPDAVIFLPADILLPVDEDRPCCFPLAASDLSEGVLFRKVL